MTEELISQLPSNIEEQLEKYNKIREAQRRANKKYRQANLDKFKGYSKKYYEKNKEKLTNNMKIYYKNSKNKLTQNI